MCLVPKSQQVQFKLAETRVKLCQYAKFFLLNNHLGVNLVISKAIRTDIEALLVGLR